MQKITSFYTVKLLYENWVQGLSFQGSLVSQQPTSPTSEILKVQISPLFTYYMTMKKTALSNGTRPRGR